MTSLRSFGAHSKECRNGFTSYSLSEQNLQSSLLLLLELLTESTFPEKELTQLKSIYLQNLKVNKEKTSFQASVLFRKTLYGIEHPYGKEVEEDEVASLDREALLQHYDNFFQSATIIVSGNVSDPHKQFIADVLGVFRAQSPRRDNSSQAKAGTINRQIISKDGSVQSSIRMGKLSCRTIAYAL